MHIQLKHQRNSTIESGHLKFSIGPDRGTATPKQNRVATRRALSKKRRTRRKFCLTRKRQTPSAMPSEIIHENSLCLGQQIEARLILIGYGEVTSCPTPVNVNREGRREHRGCDLGFLWNPVHRKYTVTFYTCRRVLACNFYLIVIPVASRIRRSNSDSFRWTWLIMTYA